MAPGRAGADLARLNEVRSEIAARFASAGCARVELATLQPADLLLDLYGEDIRSRAFVVQDPVEGELALRPDFTVPVARLHMDGGANPARYSYDGMVWRRQDPTADRPTEYLQCGVEFFGGSDPAAEEAEVFALISDALGGAGAPVTGDLGIIFAAIDALHLSGARKAALRRHVWRPGRFQSLLARFSAPIETSEMREALLGGGAAERRSAIEAAGKFVGARSENEVLERLDLLQADAAEPPLPADDRAMIEGVLNVSGPSKEALAALRALCPAAMAPALGAMERRLDALAAKGIDADALPFDAAFGRTLEYYDGFVFEFRASAPDLPPLGGGGRYDALTSSLGGGAVLPAVGGVVRPEAMIAEEAA